jgi:PPOX class probable F420-dependent enzyme
MNRRRQIALTPEEQRRYLEESLTVILTTLDRWGYPHAVAMWYVVDPDGTVVMTTYARSQKAVNVRRDPRCALLVEDGRAYEELRGLLIRGRASVEADVERTLDVLERIHAKHNQLDLPGLRDALAAQAQKRVVIRVRPERVSSWDHRKLGGVY